MAMELPLTLTRSQFIGPSGSAFQPGSQRFEVLLGVSQPTDESRLSRLTCHALVDNFLATPIPAGKFQREILSKPIEIILMRVTHCHRVDTFSNEFGSLIANPILSSRIDELITERLRQSELMIELPKQDRSCMRRQSLID